MKGKKKIDDKKEEFSEFKKKENNSIDDLLNKLKPAENFDFNDYAMSVINRAAYEKYSLIGDDSFKEPNINKDSTINYVFIKEPNINKAKVEIVHEFVPFIVEKYRENFLEILKPYFIKEQHKELSDLINNNIIPGHKLIFRGVGNRLPDAFKTLFEHKIITQCNKKQLENWISLNFNYSTNKIEKPYKLKYLNDIISAFNSISKSPILKVTKLDSVNEKILSTT